MENTLNNTDNNPVPFQRAQSLESGTASHTNSQPSLLMSHTVSMPSFQRRTVDGARQLRNNFNNVIREIQPFVETARSVNAEVQNVISMSNFLNRSETVSAQSHSSGENSNSFVINLEDVIVNRMEAVNEEPRQNEANNNTNSNVENIDRQESIMEAQQILQVLFKYIPFVVILLIKVLCDFHDALFSLIALFFTFVHSNSIVKKEAAKRQKRDISILAIELFYIFGCCVWVHIFLAKEFHTLFMDMTLIREFPNHFTLGGLLWFVLITDFMIKLFTIAVKILLTMLPAQIIAFQKRGKIYLFIESVSQMYRSMATIQPWLSYLLESYEGIGKIVSVFLSAFYMISKGGDLFVRAKLVRSSFFKLLQNMSVGTCPSKEQIQTAGEHCPICHDEYEMPVLLQCRHIFCESCVTTWFDREQTCPLCRAKIVDDPSWRDGSTTYFLQLY